MTKASMMTTAVITTQTHTYFTEDGLDFIHEDEFNPDEYQQGNYIGFNVDLPTSFLPSDDEEYHMIKVAWYRTT